MQGEEVDAFVACECYDLRAGEQFVLHHIIAYYEHTYPGQGRGQLRIPNPEQFSNHVYHCKGVPIPVGGGAAEASGWEIAGWAADAVGKSTFCEKSSSGEV